MLRRSSNYILSLDILVAGVPHGSWGEDCDAAADEDAVPVEPPDEEEAVPGQVGALHRAPPLPQPVPEGAQQLVAVLGIGSMLQ